MSERPTEPKPDLAGPQSPHFEVGPEQMPPSAWEEVEEGRFMPKRVRGSFRGRALG